MVLGTPQFHCHFFCYTVSSLALVTLPILPSGCHPLMKTWPKDPTTVSKAGAVAAVWVGCCMTQGGTIPTVDVFVTTLLPQMAVKSLVLTKFECSHNFLTGGGSVLQKGCPFLDF